MTERPLERFEPWISRERIEAYRRRDHDDLDTLITYLHNIALCEALYTPLGFLEVTLRNSLHANLSALHGSASWFALAGTLERDQRESVTRAMRRISGQGKVVTPGRVVSELNFGFWVAILSTPYDARFWRPQKARYLKASFPRIAKQQRQRPVIYRRLNDLRALRNRVFHHETIWNRATLARDYEHLHEALAWMSPDMAALCRLVDRFPDTLANGRDAIEGVVNGAAERP